ncbi:MAG: sigma-54 dependent transcriptional regulator [Chitinophagales bacterium]|nr:sigma-54 dependent transcriptional regulator [Chitinophagales bacterium]
MARVAKSIKKMELNALKSRFGIIGNSPELNYALSIAVRVAPTNLSTLITGESGVGKEIFSKIIHALSPRKHNTFIAVNCGAIPEGTIDSELFGHEKGAFTGATDQRKGYFEHAKDGTIFLDEIGEMPLGTQARLLRVLEAGEFIRVGSSKVMTTDVRVIAATNVDLLNFVKRGKFREDLYYRLSTVPIKVPPLRERKEDIYLLFRKFASDIAEKNRTTPVQLDDDAQEALIKYEWPGNVRELKNIAEQLSVLSVDRVVTERELRKYLPNLSHTRLPVLAAPTDFEGDMPNGAGNGQRTTDFSERELLYKLFFDMKKDLNDLKKFIFEFASQQHADISTLAPMRTHMDEATLRKVDEVEAIRSNPKPIVIDQPEKYVAAETVDESLSIADKEKELIERALKKHKGRRKDAATDLGISERTLYRKIKEYNIAE